MYKNTGKFMREFRLKNNLTQKQIAEVFQLNTQNVSNFERGLCHPPFNRTKKAFKKLGMTAEQKEQFVDFYLNDVLDHAEQKVRSKI